MAISARTGIVGSVVRNIGNSRAAFGCQFHQIAGEEKLGFAVGINVSRGCEVLRQRMALLASVGEIGAGIIRQVRLMRAHGRRRRLGFTIQPARRRDIGENSRVAAGIAVASVTGFRAAWLGVAGQTRIVNLDGSIILAMATLAGLEIVRIALEKSDMRIGANHPTGGGMRKTGMAGLARYAGDATVELAAVTLPAFSGIKIFRCQGLAVKTGRGQGIPPRLVNAYLRLRRDWRFFRITAGGQENQRNGGKEKNCRFHICTHLLSFAFRRQIRMACHAYRIAAFNVMARSARFHVAAREYRMLAAAEAGAEADKIRGAMGRRKRPGKAGVLIARVAIRAKSLLIVARLAIGLLGAQIESMGENEIQIMHALFGQGQLAVRRRPVFGNAANQTAAGKLRRRFSVANLAKILGMANGTIIRRALNAHQAFVFFGPRHALMRHRQQRFDFAVARFAGGFGLYIIMASAARRHHRQKGDTRFFGFFDAGVANSTFLLQAFNVAFVAEADFALGRWRRFNVFRIEMAVLAIVLDFRAVADTALFVLRQHHVVRIFTR